VASYKVRISDGSEIGPMDLAALKTWIAQGLVDGDSPVMRSGSRQWVALRTLSEFKGVAGGGSGGRKKAKRKAQAETLDEGWEDEGPTSLDAIRIRATGVLLLGAAAALGLLAWRPELALPAFDGAPWLQIALGAFALGLAVVPGWGLARRLVRVVLLLAAFALFPIAGILIAQGERGTALLVLAAVWILISGLVALLSPRLGRVGLVLAVLGVVAGAWGLVRFGRAPESEAVMQVRAWESPDRRFSDDAMGLALDLPDGWVILKPGNPLVAAPETARVTFAQPRLGGYGYITAEPAPRGVATADQYLDVLLARRKEKREGLEEKQRGNALVGSLTGRRLDATWRDKDADSVQRDLTVAGQDGWMSFALVAWMPEAKASRQGGLDDLASALSARGLLDGRLRSAVQAVVAEVPHLSAPVAEQLMSQTEARVLEPPQAFRRSVAALATLLPSLTPAQTQEISRLSSATYAGLPWAQRRDLASYIERVRKGDTTDPAEDAAMAELMKAAEMRLSAEQRLRLQAYYEQAVRAGS
jgi:GYF domain 2